MFQCCDEDLGDDILKGHPQAVSGTEDRLLTIIKQLAVIPVAVNVRRSELLSLKQDHSESVRSFFPRINGKVTTCAYYVECSNDTCTHINDFTNVIVKVVLVTGLVNDDIKKDVLGWTELDAKTVEAMVSFIEAKEMACDALVNQPVTAAISSYKANNKVGTNTKDMTTCRDCNKVIERYAWRKRQNRTIECTLCINCWQKANPRNIRRRKDRNSQVEEKPADETSALLIGAIASSPEEISVTEDKEMHKRKAIVIDHHIFDSNDGWRKSESLQHPTLRLRLTTEKTDYDCSIISCYSGHRHRSTVMSLGAAGFLSVRF